MLVLSVALSTALWGGHSTGVENKADIEINQDEWVTKPEKQAGSTGPPTHTTALSAFVFLFCPG